MGLRGLLWTLPAGHFLMQCGLGWQVALSGAFMPVVYTFAFYTKAWHADAWSPTETLHCPNSTTVGATICVLLFPPLVSHDFRFSQKLECSNNWAFDTGVPMAETVWGFWIWLTLASAALSWQTTPQARQKRPRTPYYAGFELLAAVCSAIFLASTVYYATVKQHDKENWFQSFFGW